MAADLKGLLMLAKPAGKKSPMMGPSAEDPMRERIVGAMTDLSAALKADDAESAADAFKAAVQACRESYGDEEE